VALGVFVPVACMVIVAEGTGVPVGTRVAARVNVGDGVIEAVGEGVTHLHGQLQERGFSAVATFWPSEFTQIRGQYRRTRFGEGRTADEFLFQTLFTIGAHGAHPF